VALRIQRDATTAVRHARLAALAMLACAMHAGHAQTPSEVTLDKVTVTGSHIPRTDIETALPLQIITRTEIERSGVTTVSQLLERVSANVNGFNDGLTVGQSARPGLASANLRGLGDGRTLVLLNGRRLANYAFDGATVDLNSIPLSAIDRVEILKDSASAIYGTDAIGGVINFILRKDYAGAEATGYLAATQHGGGSGSQAILTVGRGNFATDGYNVFASIAYQKDHPLAARDRDFARTSYLPAEGINRLSQSTFPANIRTGRRVLNPSAAAGCAPPTSVPLKAEACGYDFATAIDLLPAIERASLLTRGSLRLDSANELYAEYIYSRNRFETQVAPTPVSGSAVSGPLRYPAGGPFYPASFAAANGLSGDLTLAWRAVALGPRINSVRTDMQRAVVGAEGLLAGWNYNIAGVYSINHQADEFKSGFLYVGRLIPAMATGLINPFGPSGPAGDALLQSTLFSGTPHSSRGTTSLINAFGSREIMQLPGGPLALALGVDARRERLQNNWDPALQSGDPFLGFAPLTVTGSRNVYALFGELNLPIMRGVDAQLAVRFDQYSDFGSTTNPKAAVRWQPMNSLLFRASWGTGFRAPPLYDLNEPRFFGSQVAQGVRDPVRCPVTGLLDDCDGIVGVFIGGNPDLKPETSRQWNIGVIWEPLSKLSLGIDHWKINQKQRIEAFFWEFVLRSYDTIGASRVIRGPVDPNFPALPGPITAIDETLTNVAAVETSGVDVSFTYVSPKTHIGVFRGTLQGTYVSQWDARFGDFALTSFVGTDANGLAIPRWRSYVSLNWAFGVWGATLAQTYTAGYTDANPDVNGNTHKVAAFSTWDLQGTYTGVSGLQLAAGVRNLFDADPPFSNQLNWMQVGYNAQLANPLGRLFYLRATYAFR